MNLFTQLKHLWQPDWSLPIVVHVWLSKCKLCNEFNRDLFVIGKNFEKRWLNSTKPCRIRYHIKLIILRSSHYSSHLRIDNFWQKCSMLMTFLLDPYFLWWPIKYLNVHDFRLIKLFLDFSLTNIFDSLFQYWRLFFHMSLCIFFII